MSGDSFALSTEDLSRLVFTDDLTGLRNRRFLRNFLQTGVTWNDPSAPPLSLLMLDLDNFKEVNDTQGHLAGDRLLMQVASLLTDCVGTRGTVVRYAGDEFVVMLPGFDRNEARLMGESIRSVLQTADTGDSGAGEKKPLGSSIGVATFPGDAADAEGLLGKADLAMYQAKHSGKNKVSDGRTIDPTLAAERSLLENFPCARLVGRESELNAIRAQMDSCRQGGIALTVLRGRSGMGKTRLLGEIVKISGERQCITLLDRCAQEEQRFPYGSILQLLRRFTNKYSAETAALRSRLPEAESVLLGRFLPAFSGSAEGDLASLAEAVAGLTTADRTILFHALVRSFCLLSEATLSVLLLDDAEHMDEATLDVLSTVLKETEGRLLICLAVRTNDQGKTSSEAMDAFLAQAAKGPRTKALDLAPLPLRDVLGMLDLLLPGRPPVPDLDRLIVQVTQGNPLFVEESIKSLVLRRKIQRTAQGWQIDKITRVDIPPSLSEVIRGQMEGLDPISRQLIARAAVIGPNFALDLLQGIAGSNQGETLDVLDKARKARWIEPSGADSDSELKFVAHHLREVTYSNSDSQFRKQVHREIGQFEEQRSDGRLEDKASFLLYHFELGGDPERTGRYQELVDTLGRTIYRADELDRAGRHPPGLESQIAEATEPLPEEAGTSVASFLRGFPAAAKTLRMYPAGSMLVKGAIQALETSLQEVFRFARTLTLGVEQDQLHVNTQKAEGSLYGMIADEVARSLSVRSIASVSFASTLTPEDLTALLHELGRTPEAEGYPPGYWKGVLRDRGIRTIGIAQMSYVVDRSREGSESSAAIVGEIGGSVAQEMVPGIRELVRHLAGAMENVVMYPPGSRMIQAAVDQLMGALKDVLAGTRMVVFTEVDGKLVVNGTEAHGQAYGNAPAVLLRRLAARGISTLGIREGITGEEAIRFLGAVARGDVQLEGHKAWEAYLTREGVQHVVVGDRVFAAARRPKTPEPAPEPPAEKPADHASPVAQQLRKWLETGLEETKPAVLSLATLTLVEKLHLADDRAGIEKLFSTLSEAMRSPKAEVRRRAWGMAVLLTEKPSPVIAPTVAECLAFPLESAMDEEKDEDCVLKAIVTSARLLAGFVANGSYVLANRCLWGVFRRLQSNPTRGIAQVARETIEKCASLPELAILIETAGEEVEGPGAVRSGAGREFLLALGHHAAVPLFQALRRIDSLPSRRVLARVLRDLGPQAEKEVAREINPFGNPKELVRLFEVLELMRGDEPTLVIAGFKHKEESVKRAAIDLLRRLPRERAAPILAQAVEDEDPEVLRAAATAIGELRPEQGVNQLAALLRSAAPKEVKQACCLALGKFDDESAVVPLLVGTLGGGKFLGLFGGADEDLRSTAAWALGHFKGAEAREALQRALKDPSAAVRSSAKMGLKG